MRVSIEWVNSLLSKELSARQMADAMELAGIEVEEVHESKPLDPKIIVGRVKEVRLHPNADRLRLAVVDTGSNQLKIVCGAQNLAEGQLVPVATIGAVLPDGTEIKKSKIRGEESQGMICSQYELGLSGDHNGIMELKKGTIGQKIADLFTTNPVIDVKTSANRWDLTALQGVARELAAQKGIKAKITHAELDFGSGGGKPRLKSILDSKLVNAYMLAPIRVDMAKKTPEWLSRRLTASGIRPINVVVDVTNYIMLEHGQPLHAFDAGKISGEVGVRLAQKDELLVTLDGVKRILDPADIVITDSKKAIGLAGVMGGSNSEIDQSSTHILLEAASFNAAHIRKTAIRHGLRSEASARFERGVPAHPQEAMAAAIKLLQEHADGALSGTIVAWQNLDAATPPITAIAIDPRRVGKLLGMELSGDEISAQLRKLDFMVDTESATSSLTVTVPWWRSDIKHEADIAEEVIKLIGYDKLSATLPAWRAKNVKFDSSWARLWQAKAALRSLDLFEISTYSFISKKQIEDLGWKTSDFYELSNPKSFDQAYLRENLLPSLLATAVRNRKYNKQFGLFELSKGFVMNRDGELPNEQVTLGVLTVSPNHAYTWTKACLDRLGSEFNIDLTIKPQQYDKVIGHPKRSGWVYADGQELGLIGQLHPDLVQRHKLTGEVGYLEISWNKLLELYKPKEYIPRSQYPTISRDISVLVDRGVTWQEVKNELSIHSVSFISDYYGEDLPAGIKSLSLRATVSRFDKTPTEADANEEQAKILSILNTKFKSPPRA